MRDHNQQINDALLLLDHIKSSARDVLKEHLRLMTESAVAQIKADLPRGDVKMLAGAKDGSVVDVVLDTELYRSSLAIVEKSERGQRFFTVSVVIEKIEIKGVPLERLARVVELGQATSGLAPTPAWTAARTLLQANKDSFAKWIAKEILNRIRS